MLLASLTDISLRHFFAFQTLETQFSIFSKNSILVFFDAKQVLLATAMYT